MSLLSDLIGEVGEKIAEHAKWFGNAIATMPTARAVLDAAESIQASEADDLERFYRGDQWPRDITAQRAESPARPTLTVNRLPELVAAATDRQRAEGLPPLDDRELRMLQIVVTLHNRDAQVLYNYMLSRLAELVSSHETTFVSAEK